MVDQESYRSYRAYIPYFALVSVVLVAVCLRDPWVILSVITVGAYCRFLAAALIHHTGGYMNAILIVMPVLIYVLSMSGAVHLANYLSRCRTGARGQWRRPASVSRRLATLRAGQRFHFDWLGVTRHQPDRTRP